MRKNIFAIIAILALAVTALSACAKPADNTETQTSANAEGRATWAETQQPIETQYPKDSIKCI